MTREEAFGVIEDELPFIDGEELAEALEVALETLKEGRRGEWHTTPNPNYSPFDSTSEVIYMCSKCSYSSGERITSTWNFCPNCGSNNRKRGEAE